MIESPIVKVLSTIRKHGVEALLMGGQACVFYGAAEFSRDADIVLLADPENIARLRAALVELKAKQRYVPALDIDALKRGTVFTLSRQSPAQTVFVSTSCRPCAA